MILASLALLLVDQPGGSEQTSMVVLSTMSGERRSSRWSPTLLNMGEVFTSNDYPSEAVRKELEGTVLPRVDVDAQGKVVRCQIAKSSGVPELDETTCRLLVERGRFKAATNRKGRPIAGKWSKRVAWVLPEASGFPLMNGFFRAVMKIGADGTPGPCKSESSDKLAIDACALPEMAPWVFNDPAVHAQAGRSVAFEYGTLVGDTEAFAASGRALGNDLLQQRAVRLSIDEHGKVVDCAMSPIDLGRGGAPDSLCASLADVDWEPLGAAARDRSVRYLTHYIRVFLRD